MKRRKKWKRWKTNKKSEKQFFFSGEGRGELKEAKQKQKILLTKLRFLCHLTEFYSFQTSG